MYSEHIFFQKDSLTIDVGDKQDGKDWFSIRNHSDRRFNSPSTSVIPILRGSIFTCLIKLFTNGNVLSFKR